MAPSLLLEGHLTMPCNRYSSRSLPDDPKQDGLTDT